MSRGRGDGTFEPPKLVLNDFGTAQGWTGKSTSASLPTSPATGASTSSASAAPASTSPGTSTAASGPGPPTRPPPSHHGDSPEHGPARQPALPRGAGGQDRVWAIDGAPGRTATGFGARPRAGVGVRLLGPAAGAGSHRVWRCRPCKGRSLVVSSTRANPTGNRNSSNRVMQPRVPTRERPTRGKRAPQGIAWGPASACQAALHLAGLLIWARRGICTVVQSEGHVVARAAVHGDEDRPLDVQPGQLDRGLPTAAPHLSEQHRGARIVREAVHGTGFPRHLLRVRKEVEWILEPRDQPRHLHVPGMTPPALAEQ